MRWSHVGGMCQMEIWHWMKMIKSIILLVCEAETGLLLFSLQASVLKPTCQGEKKKKKNRFPPAYGISTGAPIKQLAAAALCTCRKQLILIASCHGTSNLDPCQQRRGGSFTISHTSFFSPSVSYDTWKPVAACPWQLAQPAHSAVKPRGRGPSYSPSDHLTWPLHSADVKRSNISVNNTYFLCFQRLGRWKQNLLRCTGKIDLWVLGSHFYWVLRIRSIGTTWMSFPRGVV